MKKSIHHQTREEIREKRERSGWLKTHTRNNKIPFSCILSPAGVRFVLITKITCRCVADDYEESVHWSDVVQANDCHESNEEAAGKNDSMIDHHFLLRFCRDESLTLCHLILVPCDLIPYPDIAETCVWYVSQRLVVDRMRTGKESLLSFRQRCWNKQTSHHHLIDIR